MIVLVAAVGLALAGCTTTTGNTNYAGLPADSDIVGGSPATATGPQAFWVGEGDQIAVSVWGSSTCPPIGERISVVNDASSGNTIAIEMAKPTDQPCTMDLVPHTTQFWTPAEVSTTQPLKIQVAGESITLPPK
jgi:hypothetical protein